MNFLQAKDHVEHAVGGDPSVAPNMTVEGRKVEVINHAGEQLYTRPWRFREDSYLLDLTTDQATITQPITMYFDKGGEFISMVRTVDGAEVENITPAEMDYLRDATTRTPVSGYVTHVAFPWQNLKQEIQIFPTPTSFSAAAIRMRYRKYWNPVTTGWGDDTTLSFPSYVDSLFTAYLRAYAQGYEDEGIPTRIAEIDAGPLLQTALMKDGITQRDVGRLRPLRGRGF